MKCFSNLHEHRGGPMSRLADAVRIALIGDKQRVEHEEKLPVHEGQKRWVPKKRKLEDGEAHMVQDECEFSDATPDQKEDEVHGTYVRQEQLAEVQEEEQARPILADQIEGFDRNDEAMAPEKEEKRT
jgi:hypothetical protein